MYFNKDILDDAGIEYPYQMALDGNWTLQEFTTMAKQAYNSMDKTNTGKLADDSFAYTTGWWRGPMQLLFSTGHKVITGNSSTEFALDLYNETTIKAYKEYLDDFVFSGICNNESPGNYDNMQKAFKAGRVAFYDDLIGVSHVFDGVNFGILPWPKYDTNVDGYPTVIGAEANFFIVPKTASETERTSVVLEAMSFYGYKNIVDTYFNEVLSYKYSPDAESMEILKLIKAGRLYDIGGVYRFGNDDLECISNMGYLLYKNGMNGSKASSISGIYSAYSGIAKQKFDDWGDID